jgi:uncharacterized protein YndB with AHSA1/START domain
LRPVAPDAPIDPMPTESVRVSSVLPSSADRIYAAWLDGLEHSRMTGGKATVDARIGGRHTAWDDYIEGEILALDPGRRIAQTWRASDFPQGHAHSRLEVFLQDVPGGCEVTLVHSEIPEGLGDQYEEGWSTHYFVPMKKHFGGASQGRARKAAAPEVRKAAKKPAKKAGKPKRASGSKRRAKKVAAKGTATKSARPAKKARASKAAKKARRRRRY